jgi:putative flippase GtrA
VAENASTDGTLEVARRIAAELPDVEVVALREPGRGRALRTAWLASDAAVLAYMDVDLSTDLAALLPLVAPLITGHSDLAIGSRLSRSSRVVRGPKRELISRSYNLLLRVTGTTSASDAQCGFKAIRADAAERLLPLVEDDGWFFDTELLWLAEQVGLRIHEVPVDWVDDPDSRVRIVSTARSDLAGIARLGRSRITARTPLAELRDRIGRRPLPGPAGGPSSALGRLAVFATIGAVSTVVYLLLFLLLRGIGSAQEANLGALLITAFANTAANRRLTFGVRGRAGAGRAQAQGLIVFMVGLGLTSGGLVLLHWLAPAAPRLIEVGGLIAATAVATVIRFALFRSWVFRGAVPAPAGTRTPSVPAAPATVTAGSA